MEELTNPHANQQVENMLKSFEISFRLSEIQLGEIKNIKRFQVREVLDAVGAHEAMFSKKMVDEYTESLSRGHKFPAIVFRQTDHGYDIVAHDADCQILVKILGQGPYGKSGLARLRRCRDHRIQRGLKAGRIAAIRPWRVNDEDACVIAA